MINYAKKKQMLPDLTKQDILTPLDISQLGSNGDPCFGIGYDLSTKECKLCGDLELCAFKMSQNLNITRKELEQKNQYKDLDVLEDTVGIKKFIRSLIRKGKTEKKLSQRQLRNSKYLRNVLENFIENAMGKVNKLRMIWAMFKLYLNNPNYYVRQDDVLADLFMQGEYDVERFCHSLGVTPQRGLTFGQLLKQCNIL